MKSPDQLELWARQCNAEAEDLAQRLLDQHFERNEDTQLVLTMALVQAAVAVSQLSGMGADNLRKLFDNALQRVQAVNMAGASRA
jgi:hypothetical protein